MDQSAVDNANKLIKHLSSRIGDLTAENAFLKIQLENLSTQPEVVSEEAEENGSLTSD